MSESIDGALVKVGEAARKLGVSRRTLEREMARGRFPRPLKIGRASLVAVDEIAIFIEQLRNERNLRPL